MKRINSRYKLIEFLSGRRSSANTVVNVAKVGFKSGAVVLIKKLVFNVAYVKIGVAGSHSSDCFKTIEVKFMNACAVGFTFVCDEALRQSNNGELAFSIIPFAIVAYASLLLFDNLFRNRSESLSYIVASCFYISQANCCLS